MKTTKFSWQEMSGFFSGYPAKIGYLAVYPAQQKGNSVADPDPVLFYPEDPG
jgi:hypothetical protein